MNYILDTNICIYMIKQKPASVLNRFRQLQIGDVMVSSITVAELEYGVQKSSWVERNQQALHQFLLRLEIVSFDAQDGVIYGKIRGYLEKEGTPIGGLDMLIAAQAMRLNATLVTNNVREFERIPQLLVENWV